MNELTVIQAELSIANIPSDQNPALIYIASLGSKHSKAAMINALNKATDLLLPGRFPKPGKDASESERELYRTRFSVFPWAALRAEHIKAIKARLTEEDYAPATVNQTLAALRGVLSQAEDLEQISASDMRKATKIKPVKGLPLPAGRELSSGEIKALSDVCKADKSPLGARDRAMIALMYATGVRRAELVALDLADFEAATGMLTIRSGKGRRGRTAYITNNSLSALTAWLNVREQDPGPMFLEVHRGGHIQHNKRLATQAVYKMLKERGKQAGLEKFSPHDFRRTFISDLLDRGVDISTVAKMAGHASVTTTARYDRRGEETKKKAAGLLHFPD